MKRPRVLLADDHRLLREAFAHLLEPSCEVVGAVGDGRALLEAAQELRPDIVVLDIAMPLLNGLDAARQLKASMPEVRLDLPDRQRGSRPRRGGLPGRGVRLPPQELGRLGAVQGDPRGLPGTFLRHAAGH